MARRELYRLGHARQGGCPVGEFPFNPSADTTGQSFGGINFGTLVSDFYNEGYAGTMGWAYSDTTGAGFSWSNAKANVKAWADAHTCIHY